MRLLESSPRSRVWRVELPPPGGPAVVKQLVDGPEARERYTREVTTLRAAGRVEPLVAPRLLGSDPDQLVLVLEYLEDRPPPGGDWVIGWAAALARLHAVGAVDAPDAQGAPGSGVDSLPLWAGPSAEDVRSFLALARVLGVPVSAGVQGELDGVVARLAGAPGRALLHGDPCPDNARHTAGGVRFVDFEHCGRGDGRVELAYLRTGFPTCWCATAPDPDLLDAAENAYRATWQSATGSEVSGDLADACVGWLVRGDGLVERARRTGADHWGRLLDQDWTWGIATARQRLRHRLLVVGQLAGERGPLAETGRLAGDMAVRVLSRWPGLRPLPTRWRWREGLAGR